MNSSSANDLEAVPPTMAEVTEETLTVELADGRTIVVPTAWYPRLACGTPREWANYELSDLGIHWPDLDEDISVSGLLLGRKSGESGASLKFWMDARKKGKQTTLEEFVRSRRKHKAKKSA